MSITATTDALPENPTQDILWDVIAALLVKFVDALPGVQVIPGWPGDTAKNECVWISDMSSTERTVPGFVGDTRVMVDETYDVVFEIEVRGRAQLNATQRRLSQIVGAMDAAVREDPRLGDFPGLIECLFTQIRRKAGIGDTGHEGVAQMTLEVHTRLY